MERIAVGATKIIEETEILARLAAFDPQEIDKSLEFHGLDVTDHVDVAVKDATRMLRVAKIQLEQENLTHLEYSVYKLRSIFLAIGCHRLSFLFEKIYKNLTKIRIEYLRELFSVVREEFQTASNAIKEFLGSGDGLIFEPA